MSKAKERDNKDPNAAALKPVPVPSLPKLDDAQRERWSNDYDKVENELLKPHLGQGSRTLGLRQLTDPTFDRAVPDPSSELPADRPRPRPGGKNAAGAAGGKYGAKTFAGGQGTATSAHGRPRDMNGTVMSSGTFSAARSPVAGGSSPSPTFSGYQSYGGAAGKSAAGGGSPTPGMMLSTFGSSKGRSPTRGSQANVSACLPDAPTRGMDPQRLLRVLLTMLQPPVKFRSQCAVDLQHIGLSWMLDFQTGDRAPVLQSLDTMRDDLALGGSEAALTSPRSTVVILRNGVGVKHLQERPLSDFLVAHESDQEVAQLAHRHFEDRRTALLEALREDYRDLCSSMSLFDILDILPEYRDGGDFKLDVTFLQRRAERQTVVAELNKQRAKKQLEQEAEMAARATEAERRRRALAVETEAKTEAKKKELARRRELAHQRMEQLKASTAAIAEGTRIAAEEKQRIADEREQDRQRQRQERLLNEKYAAEAKAAEKKARMEQNRILMMRQQQEIEEARMEKEHALEERRREGEAKRLAVKEQQQAQQAKAARQREAARQKAAIHEELMREQAEERRAQAEARLQSFQEEQARRREEQRQIELIKAQHKKGVAVQADLRRQQRSDAIVDRETTHAEAMTQVKKDRERQKNFDHVLASLANDDKQFLVERQRRARQFGKVVNVSNIQEREHRAEAVAKKREQLTEAARRDRERSRLEHERLRAEIQEKH